MMIKMIRTNMIRRLHRNNIGINMMKSLLSTRSNKIDDYQSNINKLSSKLSLKGEEPVICSMYNEIAGTDKVAVHIDKFKDPTDASLALISVAAPNTLPEEMLNLVSRFMKAKNFNIHSSHFLDTAKSSTGYVTLLRLLVGPDPTNTYDDNEMTNFVNDIKRLKWIDDEVIDFGLVKYPSVGLARSEVIVALCSMLHGSLNAINNQEYASVHTSIKILDKSPQFIKIASAVANLFLAKFNPSKPLNISDFELNSAKIKSKIDEVHLESAKLLLTKMLDAVHATLRTNFFNSERYALSVRINPAIMSQNSPLPYGVFFCHGRNFNAFHCRFRDIARGGLRIVIPSSTDQFFAESSRLYDEAYGLSLAQQLKNKDIPEGGSKAVILLKNFNSNKDFHMRKSVKAFVDSILDLIVKDSVKNIVDYYNKEEIIFLGPDENILPNDIEWICDRAYHRGYPIPAAFMSSKKDNGINHKEFGVTSEGVVCFLDIALRNSKIDPTKDSFTVKITGGPDGDVAGNLIKILFRDYKSTCKIVGIADGSGVAEDPTGLDNDELLRLVKDSLPITSFNKEKLGVDGLLFDITTAEGMSRQSSMCFRVKSDVFIPAGGRPNTINANNWNKYLDSNGHPSSPLIVEGANIFITSEARALLWTKGVKIIKDSSANKAGVITSSCEVQASMLLSKDEFIAIKDDLVKDVLLHLKNVARLEAGLLFREFQNYRGSLPFFSERISEAINKTTDAISEALEHDDPLFTEMFPVMLETLPKKLVEFAGDRISTCIPIAYQKNAIASSLASKIVYREGYHYVLSQSPDQLAKVAIEYYRHDKIMQTLLADVEKDIGNLSSEQKEKVITLLKIGGVRASLGRY